MPGFSAGLSLPALSAGAGISVSGSGLVGNKMPAPLASGIQAAVVPAMAAAVPAVQAVAAQPDAAGAAPQTGEQIRLQADRTFDNAYGNAAALPDIAVGAVSGPLDSALPVFAQSQVSRVRLIDRAMTAAAQEASGIMFGNQAEPVQSRGSSARLTYADANPDYDILVKLPSGWTSSEVDRFLSSRLKEYETVLSRCVAKQAALLFPGKAVRVLTPRSVRLMDPWTGRVNMDVGMVSLEIRARGGDLLVDADVTLTNREDYANSYPEYFSGQMRQIAAREGAAAAQQVLSDIRLAKRFFKDAVQAYKIFNEGGPGGVGIEQMVMQSGRVSESDQGRTVLETGSFDRMMERLYRAMFDEHGEMRGLQEARREWVVHNPFMEPKNFLELIRDQAWMRLAYAVKKYREARIAGRPVTMAQLRYEKSQSPLGLRGELRRGQKNSHMVNPGGPKVSINVVSFKSFGHDTQEAVDAVLRGIPDIQSVKILRVDSRKKKEEKRYRVEVQLMPGSDKDSLLKVVVSRLAESSPFIRVITDEEAAQPSPKISGTSLVLTLAPSGSFQNRQSLLANLKRVIHRLERHLPQVGERQTASFREANGTYEVMLPINPGSAEAIAEKIQAFLKASQTGIRLKKIAYPKPQGPNSPVPGAKVAPQPGAIEEAPGSLKDSAGSERIVNPEAEAPKAEADDAAPGALTLRLLDKFTLTGPRPAQRGPEFLYAQGAQALPSGLDASWRVRPQRGPVEAAPGSRVAQALLLRRKDKIYVSVPLDDGKGKDVLRRVRVPAQLAQGVISDTVVEVAYTETGVTDLRPIGAYPFDVMIGRVARLDGREVLEGLFRAEGKPVSLYAPLPINGGAAAAEGEIVQAFVRPAADGFEAVPLISLGREVTPEIAAREIALRHGARAYFDEDVIRQAEDIGRAQDPAAEFAAIQRRSQEAGSGHVEDLRGLPFVTVDPVGAGDLDDAFYAERQPDGGMVWYLATAGVSQLVRPGSPAFRAAARIGNTFYSIDKDGVPEYPMNHPVVSKHAASLLPGKDSLAMVTRMRFDPAGRLVPEASDGFIAAVRVQGRYNYDQVARLWKGLPDHGIEHVEQIALARELARTLDRQDFERGKLKISVGETEHFKRGGLWTTEKVVEDPLTEESHRLIEELKVYGNLVIQAQLNLISEKYGVAHLSRVHPAQEEAINERLREELESIGAPWKGEPLGDYLARLQARKDASPELKEVAQMLALTSRRSASYAAVDVDGHEGLALGAGAYGHPSTPIRRFSDMYNSALRYAYLTGEDPGRVHAAILADLQAMGFSDLDHYLVHLNGREQATRQMDYEVDDFMSVYEFAKPENQGRNLSGYVKLKRGTEAVIQVRAPAVSFTVRGKTAESLKLLDEVEVKVRGAFLEERRVDAKVRMISRSAAPHNLSKKKARRQKRARDRRR